MLKYYKNALFVNDAIFLNKYLKDPLLQRLKNVGYFCGMDYASKDIYNFSEYISRYDHSLNVALLIFKLTKDKKMSVAGLYHDISSPCFSHVIDYMNNDRVVQESTESYTTSLLVNDEYLQQMLQKDYLSITDIIDFKKYTVVDNDRPKVCADRVDGVILNSMGWVQNITKEDIASIVRNLRLYHNEQEELEIGFYSEEVAQKFTDLNNIVNEYMHSKEDIYMMELLASMTKYAITSGYIKYDDLYVKDEPFLINIFNNIPSKEFQDLYDTFLTIKKEDIPETDIEIKDRTINPLVKSKRLIK